MMFWRRHILRSTSVVIALVICTVNLRLLNLHHKLPSDEIFLTHFNTEDKQPNKPEQSAKQRKSAYTSSCYRPSSKRKLQSNETLSFPVINLGFPKMGTSSIHAFFGCAGYRSMHFRCHPSYACAECLQKQYHNLKRDRRQGVVVENKVDLKSCGISDVYSQIDRDNYFPQMSILEQILNGHPNATYFLTFRTMEKWYHSISHWPPDVPDEYLLKNRLYAPGLKFGGNLTDYASWFCNHVERVRELIQSYPHATLVEIDIEDNAGTAAYMSDLYNIDEGCWGRANVNFDLHGESIKDEQDERDEVKAQGSMPWFIQGKNMIRGKNGVMRSKFQEIDLPGEVLSQLAVADKNSTSTAAIDIAGSSILKRKPLLLGSNETNNETTSQNIQLLPLQKSPSLDDYCNALLAHEKGHWEETLQDTFPSFIQSNPSVRQLLFPKEKEWLKGNAPWYGYATCVRENKMLMYNGIVGHQCGCGVKDFEPSIAEWVYDSTPRLDPIADLGMKSEIGFHSSWTEYYKTSATLRLARKLAASNATLCFSGDSIDYQIYYGMQNNLKRASQLHAMHFPGSPEIVKIMDRLIPVKYSTEPGTVDDWYLTGKRPPDGDGSFVNGTRPPPGGFGSMHSILETKAWFKEYGSGNDKLARIRYFMTYGWSPWNIEFMEDCNIVIMNLGLHYSPDNNHTGRQTRRPLMDDLRATFTYLANFTSSENKNRVAVWRSALPQHFDTIDGHFYGWDNLPTEHTCVDLKKNMTEVKTSSRQVYNFLYDELFASMCQEQIHHHLPSKCSHLEHVCSVDITSTDYPTIFKYWMDNNCPDKIEREKDRLGNETNITGTILRWNIFDLFDNTKWHSKDMDCTHHCYVPTLYDNAFERLELLLTPLMFRFENYSFGASS